MSNVYNSNFDDSAFKKVPLREFNRTMDDPCALQQRNNDNSKKLKFITTNHRDLIEAKENLNFFGMTTKDKLFVPSEGIDEFSKLRNGQLGGKVTNCNIRNEVGQLPIPTLPAKYQLYHGDVEVEDNMRHHLESNRKACNPKDSNFHDRYFYIFNESKGIETPQAIKSVDTAQMGPRGGLSTRFLNKKCRK